MRGNGLKNALALLAMLHFDEGDQRAATRDDVEFACGGHVTPRQDAPAREPEAQRAEALCRKTTRVSRALFLYGSTAHSSRARDRANARV